MKRASAAIQAVNETVSENKWMSLIGLVIALGGLLSQPEILNFLPEKWATVASALGIFIQAVTKSLFGTK